jgi:hypothetical protein
MSDPSGIETAKPDRHPTLTVGVIVERRKAKSPWQDFVWQPVEAVLLLPSIPAWTVMREEGGTTRFYAGAFTMELYPRETVSYRMNVMSETPGVYVVLRSDPAAPQGLRLELVTVSPAEAEAYMEGGHDVVDRVKMEDAVLDWLADYVETFHVEEQFRKRRRDKRAGRPPPDQADMS